MRNYKQQNQSIDIHKIDFISTKNNIDLLCKIQYSNQTCNISATTIAFK